MLHVSVLEYFRFELKSWVTSFGLGEINGMDSGVM